MKGLSYMNFMAPSNLNIPKVCDFRGYTLGAERRGYGGVRDDSKHEAGSGSLVPSGTRSLGEKVILKDYLSDDDKCAL